MKKSYFYGDVKEQTYRTGYSFKLPSGDWELGDEYSGMMTSVGYFRDKERRYERLIEKKVFFCDDLSVEFEIGWKVKVGKDTVKILDVIHNLDGSIEYYTDKVIEITTI